METERTMETDKRYRMEVKTPLVGTAPVHMGNI
jgi:hypothetical protein